MCVCVCVYLRVLSEREAGFTRMARIFLQVNGSESSLAPLAWVSRVLCPCPGEYMSGCVSREATPIHVQRHHMHITEPLQFHTKPTQAQESTPLVGTHRMTRPV